MKIYMVSLLHRATIINKYTLCLCLSFFDLHGNLKYCFWGVGSTWIISRNEGQ